MCTAHRCGEPYKQGQAHAGQIGAQIGGQIGGQISAQIGAQIGAQICAQIGAQIGAQTGLARLLHRSNGPDDSPPATREPVQWTVGVHHLHPFRSTP
jgi:hypothetical protein